MAYHQSLFLFAFLPIFLIAYQITPQRLRSKTLLLFNLVFYFLMSAKLIVYLLLIALVSFIFARYLESSEKKKFLFHLAIWVPLGFLLWFKYYNFFAVNINRLLPSYQFPYRRLVQPIGISFFSLQAISYLTDVKNKKYPAEKNFLNYLLFLSFFPTIIEGPIARYDQISENLQKGEAIHFHNLRSGFQRILWGLMKKVVIADRIDPFVMTVFSDVSGHSGAMLLSATLLYTFQLYAEFSGTMDIVLGVSEMIGVSLPENFNQPFMAKTVSEFWRRWHMTLGAFFKDYIFYPISLSKTTRKLSKMLKKPVGKYYARALPSLIALFAVWLANGLWHGAQWQYILYGMYYFGLISLGILCEPLFVAFFKKTKLKRDGHFFTAVKWLRTFILVNIGMLIFRAHGVRAAWAMLQKIVFDFHLQDLSAETFLGKGLDFYDLGLLFVSLIIVVIVSMMKEKGVHIRENINQWHFIPRTLLHYAAMFYILIFGAYGYGYAIVELIYANF